MTNLDLAKCSYLRLPFDFDPRRLQADLESDLGEPWTPHFNRDYYHGIGVLTTEFSDSQPD